MKTSTIIMLFVLVHLLFILLHIYKEALFVNMSYAYQKKQHELAVIKDECDHIELELARIKNPATIAAYAKETLGMTPLTLAQRGSLYDR